MVVCRIPEGRYPTEFFSQEWEIIPRGTKHQLLLSIKYYTRPAKPPGFSGIVPEYCCIILDFLTSRMCETRKMPGCVYKAFVHARIKNYAITHGRSISLGALEPSGGS